MPLWIHLPGQPAQPIEGLSQIHDLYATILDWFGVEPPTPVHSRSLLPLCRGEATSVRDEAIYGWFGQGVNITDGQETYLCQAASPDNVPLEIHSQRWSTAPWWELPAPDAALEPGSFMPFTTQPLWRRALSPADQRPLCQGSLAGLHPNQLFDLRTDPGQLHPVADDAREQAWRERLRAALTTLQAPESQFARLGL